MANVFLFGTLCWAPLLLRVAGPACPQPVRASLPGYQVTWANDQAFPAIHAKSGAHAAGILLKGCPDDVLDRMDHYESGFGYTLHNVEAITDGAALQAQVYLPPDGIDSGPSWVLSDWTGQHGALALEAAKEIMDAIGQMTPAQMARRYPMMKVRADARLNARSTPSPQSPSGLDGARVEVVNTRRPYTEFFAVEECDIRVPKFDGGVSDVVTRAVFVGSDAAIVLPYDPVRDRVLLIEQFRAAPFVRSDPNPWMMEPIAGRCDPGETAEGTLRREAMEEAHLDLQALHHVHSGYASPGCSTEVFHVYIGIADIPDGAAILAGLATEAEDIKGHIFAFPEFLEKLKSGGFPVTPLALAGYWLAAHRDSLRPPA